MYIRDRNNVVLKPNDTFAVYDMNGNFKTHKTVNQYVFDCYVKELFESFPESMYIDDKPCIIANGDYLDVSFIEIVEDK